MKDHILYDSIYMKWNENILEETHIRTKSRLGLVYSWEWGLGKKRGGEKGVSLGEDENVL